MTAQSYDVIVVRGTEVVATDPVRTRLQKIARITLDSMVQFVGLLDAEGTVLEINKVALDAVGIRLGDVEGKPFWTTFWWQVSDTINLELREMIRRAAQGEFVRWDTEIFGRAGGKETIIIDASLMPVVDDAGKVVFICAEGRDITEKKAQERLIAQQNIELHGLLERIRELDEIKTQFFANVSHELRTPLSLILGPAQRLIDDDGTMTATERREGAHVVARNARMLLKHVNDLLEMSRIEARKLKIDLQPTDVAAAVRFLASHFAVLATDKGITFDVDANGETLAAIDPDKIHRVVMNLLANAFKFTPAGGRVRCALEERPGELLISIDDSGPGVKPELRQAIFERFRQGDGGSARIAGGTGLGLAIAKEFVEMHQGRIEVVDSDFGGARFEVTLPLHRVDSDGAVESSYQSSENRATLEGLIEELRPALPSVDGNGDTAGVVGRPRILVVEDNAEMNRFIVQCLSKDYEVMSAFDGNEGFQKALAFRPVLVLSDIMMPTVSGPEMIDRMRAVPELRDTAVIVLSAKADDQLMVKLLDDGARDFIVKPFSERDVAVRVRNAILAEQASHDLKAALKAAEDARQDAEKANLAKSQFLAAMSHELRTPLNAIQGHVQLIELGLHGPITPDQREALERVQRSQLALQSLINDVLNFARIEAGRVEYHIRSIGLRDAVTAVLQMIEPQLKAKTLLSQVDIPAEVAVAADPDKLQQILLNLLSNAMKFTGSGGCLTVDTGARDGLTSDVVFLRVADTGFGIPRSRQDDIFDPFVQLHPPRSVSAGGIGLGLAISRDLARGMRGDLRVRSIEGRGSVFTLTLPRG